MRIIRVKDYEELSRVAADIIFSEVTLKPDAVLGLATGSTPVGTYKNLIAKYEAGELDFSNVSSINLDEYVGLDGSSDQSYRYFMNDNLFDHINIDKARTYVPDGSNPDAEAACGAHEAMITKLGGIDLQLLGIGSNGHIAFNEPCDHFPMATHKVGLTQSTIDDNARFFDSIDDVPKSAYTMGIGSIMSARRIVILASGANKADAVAKSFFGPITPEVPASILQLHPNVIAIVDEAAYQKVQ